MTFDYMSEELIEYYKEKNDHVVWSGNDIIEENDNGYRLVADKVLKAIIKPNFMGFAPDAFYYMFYGFENMTEIEGLENLNFSNVIELNSMFSGCKSLKSVDLSHFDTSKVNRMDYMFSNCNSLKTLDLSSFDTGNVIYMDYMFSECTNLETIESLSSFNTSNVLHMSRMFYRCESLTDLDGVKVFRTDKVTQMSEMFTRCKNISRLDVSKFNTAKATDLNCLFSGCANLTSIDVSHFNTSNVTNMYSMFSGCKKLKELDLSSFDVSKVESFVNMFSSCSNLKTILCNDTWPAGTKSDNMFYLCDSLSGAISYDKNKLTAAYANPTTGYFTMKPRAYAIWCEGTKTLYFDYIEADITAGSIYEGQTVTTVWTDDKVLNTYYRSAGRFTDAVYPFTPNVERVVFKQSFENAHPLTTQGWFAECVNLKDITGLTFLNTDEVTDMSNMFYKCSMLENIDLSHFNTSNVTTLYGMFNGCSALKSINLSSFDTSNVTNMSSMFYGCLKLTSLDLSGFNTSKVTIMTSMFSQCKALIDFNLSGFDTSNVTDMASMFNHCEAMTDLDLIHFDTSNVTTMYDMFGYCTSLTTLDLSGFDTSNVTDMQSMFERCSKLESLNIVNFMPSKTTGINYMFIDCSQLKTIYCNFTWTNTFGSFAIFTGCDNLIGAVKYDSSQTDVSMANPNTGYFTNGPMVCVILCGYPPQKPYIGGEGTLFFDYAIPSLIGDTYDGYNVLKVWSGNEISKSLKCVSGFIYSLYPSEVDNSLKDNFVGEIEIKASFANARPRSLAFWFSFGSLEQIIGLNYLNTSEVTDMSHMFYECGVTSLDLSNFDTSKVTNMSEMFRSCSVQSLDLSHFDTSNVESMSEMFYDCSNLETIYCNDTWNANNDNGNSMFDRCYKLKGAISYDSKKTDVTYANPENGYFTKTKTPGDVNEDGKIDINDVVAIINVMAGTAHWSNANVNGDSANHVDINDVVSVINIMAGH